MTHINVGNAHTKAIEHVCSSLAENNKTMADMQKSLLEETKNILRRIERGDAATVVSVADVG